MQYAQAGQPAVSKPIMIAAMQDMGNIGSIVVDFVNKSMSTKSFRTAKAEQPTYVIDKCGHIEIPDETWQYAYADGLIVFGGGANQPQSGADMSALCKDVIDVAVKHSVKLIYTVGAYRTDRTINGPPRTYVTTTSVRLTEQVRGFGAETTPKTSIITGFNGIILGYAKERGIQGIGVYGEINNPHIPQYRAAISVIRTLEKLTYRTFGNTEHLEFMAQDMERRFRS